jgi:diguanylate cyclase (GGDEF)-like protein|tara:strand:+ start:120925 stop:121704 length:780 start_codon:yes stop_codon:yes gene_type:complete
MLTQPSEISAYTHSHFVPMAHDIETLLNNKANTSNWGAFTTKALSIFHTMRMNLKEAQQVIADQQKEIMILEKLADTDFLTGLANRRQFERSFNMEIERVNRGKSRGGLLVMIDLDNFKQINDQHGHQAGDECLKLVADLLENETRSLDVAARLGGDEFVVIFADADADIAIDRTQEIGQKLNQLCLNWNGKKIEIRASLGLRKFAKGDNVKGIMSAADDTLYQEKENNKNKRFTPKKIESFTHQLLKGEKISVLTLNQ